MLIPFLVGGGEQHWARPDSTTARQHRTPHGRAGPAKAVVCWPWAGQCLPGPARASLGRQGRPGQARAGLGQVRPGPVWVGKGRTRPTQAGPDQSGLGIYNTARNNMFFALSCFIIWAKSGVGTREQNPGSRFHTVPHL